MSGDIKEKIARLKKKKNAAILAHNYQLEEVQLLADVVGDSLELSRQALALDREVIVFAGVKFMAETAKVLSPAKKVLLPRLDAGCPMADMITVDELRELKKQYPDARVVAYVNSTVEIKAESDLCCTSANADSVVRHCDSRRIIFVPDRNLGAFVQSRVPEKEVILFEGFCYVHDRIKVSEVMEMKRRQPRALILAHPEVRPEVGVLADEILSTSGMIEYVARSSKTEFIILSEEGLLQRLRRENKGRRFFSAMQPKVCSNMKKTSLQDVYDALQDEKYEIIIPETVREKAQRSLQAMVRCD